MSTVAIKSRDSKTWATLAVTIALIPIIGLHAGWVLAFIPMLIISALIWQEDIHGMGVDIHPVALAGAWILINAADALITVSILLNVDGAVEANPVMAAGMMLGGFTGFIIIKMVMATLIALRVLQNSSIVRAGLVLLIMVIVNNVAVAASMIMNAGGLP